MSYQVGRSGGRLEGHEEGLEVDHLEQEHLGVVLLDQVGLLVDRSTYHPAVHRTLAGRIAVHRTAAVDSVDWGPYTGSIGYNTGSSNSGRTDYNSGADRSPDCIHLQTVVGYHLEPHYLQFLELVN